MNNSTISILLIADYSILRSALRMLIETNDRLRVIGEAAETEEALVIIARDKPNVIVVDLPDFGGNDLFPFLQQTVVKQPKVSEISVAIVAQFQLVQESLKFLIDSHEDLNVIGTFGLVDNAVTETDLQNVDVAVVFLDEGAEAGTVGEIHRLAPSIRVVVITIGSDMDAQAQALKLGAVGIVKAEQSSRMLVEAIRQTHKGDTWLNQVLLNKLLENGRAVSGGRSAGSKSTGIESLTKRELEVIQMIGRGFKSKLIAEELSISEATVRHHLSSIYDKLNVVDRLNLVIYAYQKGLIRITDAAGNDC